MYVPGSVKESYIKLLYDPVYYLLWIIEGALVNTLLERASHKRDVRIFITRGIAVGGSPKSGFSRLKIER